MVICSHIFFKKKKIVIIIIILRRIIITQEILLSDVSEIIKRRDDCMYFVQTLRACKYHMNGRLTAAVFVSALKKLCNFLLGFNLP